MKKIYKITAKVSFPEGVSPGAGTSSNRQIIARNGRDEIVLRGSALAGALRSAYLQFSEAGWVDDWFGSALDQFRENESLIRIADAVIACGTVNERTHNMVNRHTGAVAKGALFSLEAVPPGATAALSIILNGGAEQDDECENFVSDLAKIFGGGLIVGGNGNRGIGRMLVEDGLYWRKFDLGNIEDAAAWLDAQYEEQKSGVQLKGKKVTAPEDRRNLNIDLILGVPRGEDILIGDGQDSDYALRPQKVIFVDGSEHWRIPGSSLRGIIRNWMTRLAVRDGKDVRDSSFFWEGQIPDNYKADEAGWGFVDPEERESYKMAPSLLDDPILDLFGSMYKKGRIHITDSFSLSGIDKKDAQERMHVAIDRFSGGSNEGALFDNQVLVAEKLRFPLKIIVSQPTQTEVEWLVKTLRAIHLGILLVGSSKSGGRLEIKSLAATGKYDKAIDDLSKEIM